MLSATLLLAQARPTSTGDTLVIVGGMAVIALPILVFALRRTQADARRKSEAFEQNQLFQRTAFERDQAMNQIVADKYKAEAKLLDLQLKLAQTELDHRERSQAFESMAKQKMQLEIESLKLHIREQRKGLDEFGLHSDDE